jgi:hypothetical protein
VRRPTEPGSIAAIVAVALAVVVGVDLRLQQLPWHQNVWGIDWLGYFEPQARSLRHGNVVGWALSWEGLHPPLSGAIHGFFQALSTSFTIHWGLTVAAGLGAVVILGAGGWKAVGSPVALVLTVGFLAVAPMQANYGLNASPYPWALLGTALSTVALLSAIEADTPQAWRRSAWASALAAQVHILVTAVVLGQILLLLLHGPSWIRARKVAATRWALVVGISLVVIVGMSLTKTSDPWTFHIQEQEPWIRTAQLMLTGRFVPIAACWGIAGWAAFGAVAGLALPASRRAVGLLLLQALGYLAALGLFYDIHVADPRLTHYYVVPQMLLLAAGSWGLAAAAQKLGRAGPAAALAVAVGASATWGIAAAGWYQDKAADAQEAIASSAAEQLRPYWSEAGDGDVVLYLWEHSFLNDEPEYMDPIAARWPTWRTGRPCYDDPDPRLLCNRYRGAHFYFSPNLLGREEYVAYEETLRLMINMSHPPGRTVVIAVPNPGESPPRPWSWEAWLGSHGATVTGPLAHGVMVYELPGGTVIAEPPPQDPE